MIQQINLGSLNGNLFKLDTTNKQIYILNDLNISLFVTFKYTFDKKSQRSHKTSSIETKRGLKL